MESSMPSFPSDQAPRPLPGDEEAQLDAAWRDRFQGGGKHREMAQHPRRLLQLASFMLCTSVLLAFTASAAVWLFQLLRCIIFRDKPESEVLIILRTLKFAPRIFIGAMMLELAAFTWWWLQGLRGRRRDNPWFSFPVLRVLLLFFSAFDGSMNYWSPLRWYWGRR